MAWRGAVTKFEILFQHLAGRAQEPCRHLVRIDGKLGVEILTTDLTCTKKYS
jgi:hypothetical protein